MTADPQDLCISDLPEQELVCDLLDGIKDAQYCERAIAEGFSTYGQDNKSVSERLETNLKINDTIRAELHRRWSKIIPEKP